jgi:glucoamylase
MVESAGGLLALGARADVNRRLNYLQTTQEADGRWQQNMWLNGKPFWTGLQLCETALPVLLVDLLRREEADRFDDERYWPMVRSAAGFILRHGPTTDEDRWERQPGYTSFTIAAAVAALCCAAELAEALGDDEAAQNLRETADGWNGRIEGWLYVTDTELSRRLGIEGYYARVLPADAVEPPECGRPAARLRSNPQVNGISATEVVSPDALALVRFGLRRPDDPRMISTVKAVDAVLRVETPHGPCWKRYNGDDYGETDDGRPFPGRGQCGHGRPWPLLTGERAHFELAAGRRELACRLMETMQAFAGEGNLLPEQIWDGDDLPEFGLRHGRPTGSAMPLVWAHAEFIKLHRSLRDGRVFDMPTATESRYVHDGPTVARYAQATSSAK